MLKKAVFASIALYVIASAVILVLGLTAQETTAPTEPLVQVPDTTTTQQTADSATATGQTQEPTSTTQAAQTCGNGGPCTTTEVAQHATQEDCWVIYQSQVFDVTSYVSQHPGGRDSFDTSTCGTDIEPFLLGQAGSATQNEQFNHPSRAFQDLAQFYIAELAQ